MITKEDYVAGKAWPDSLCYAFYPVDLHENATGVRPSHLAEGVVPTIPLRAQLVRDVENLLVAGRCISSDRLAHSGLRVQVACRLRASGCGCGCRRGAEFLLTS